jgi:hypothetical protein
MGKVNHKGHVGNQVPDSPIHEVVLVGSASELEIARARQLDAIHAGETPCLIKYAEGFNG